MLCACPVILIPDVIPIQRRLVTHEACSCFCVALREPVFALLAVVKALPSTVTVMMHNIVAVPRKLSVHSNCVNVRVAITFGFAHNFC